MTKQLCSACMESFDDEGHAIQGEKLCPACHARMLARQSRSSQEARGPQPFPEEEGGFLSETLLDITEWCRGRWWAVRAPLLLWFAYMLYNMLLDAKYQPLFKGLNLGIHEAGHFIFAFGGQFITVLGGTLAQCLAPVISAALFWKQRDYFAIAVCGAWLATSLFDVAVYVADARAMALPLVAPGGVGGPITHDWNWMLQRTGLLMWDTTFGSILRVAGEGLMIVSIIAGIWLLWKMAMLKSGKRG